MKQQVWNLNSSVKIWVETAVPHPIHSNVFFFLHMSPNSNSISDVH